MLAKDIFVIVTPGLALTFAMGFICVWRSNPKLTHILRLALAYAMIAVCFIAPWMFQGELIRIGLLISGICGMLVPIPIAQGLLMRLNGEPPTRTLLAVGGIGVAVFIVATFATASMAATFITSTVIASVQVLVVAERLYNYRNRSLGDYFVPFVLGGAMVLLLAHLVTMGYSGIPAANIYNFFESNYWATLNMVMIFVMTAVAINLTILTMIDVTSALRKRAAVDELSSLYRRGEFTENVNRVLAKSLKTHSEVGLIVCDIDHFKSINDRHGHAVGDKVIARFGELLKELVPENAYAGRIGGEEFAVLLRNCNQATARLFAEQVRVAFENTEFGAEVDHRRFTVSAGVATGRGYSQYRDIFAPADGALYKAKDLGRNTVCFAARTSADSQITPQKNNTTAQRLAS